MSLLKKYEPRRLSEVVGQPAVRVLRAFAAEPRQDCFLLEGPGGIGKTASAHAFARELGCRPFPEHTFSGLQVIEGAALKTETVQQLFGDNSPMRFRGVQTERRDGVGWHCVVIEEFDWASPQAQKALKTALDPNNPKSPLRRWRVIVVATSNGAGKIDGPLLQRFHVLPFSGGPTFADSCLERLQTIWQHEVGVEVRMPAGWDDVGWVSDPQSPSGKSFSMRVALKRLDMHAMLQRVVRGEEVLV